MIQAVNIDQLCFVLAQVLVHFWWQGLLITLLTIAALKTCNFRSSFARYYLLLTAFFVLAASPVVTGIVAAIHYEPVPSPTIADDGSSVVATMWVTPSVPASAEEKPGLLSQMLTTTNQLIYQYQSAIFAVWVFGNLLMLSRMAISWLSCRRWKKNAVKLGKSSNARLEQLKTRMMVSKRVLIRSVSGLSQAIAIGLFKPMVLIPASWMSQIPFKSLEAIVAHELAHIRRFDLWVNVFQRIIEALFFYHPSVWWISRRIRIEREMCCDKIASDVINDPVAYAQTLSQVASFQIETSPSMSLGATFIGGPKMLLLARIKNVLTPDAQPRFGAGIAALSMSILLALPIIGWAATQEKQDDTEITEKKQDDQREAEAVRATEHALQWLQSQSQQRDEKWLELIAGQHLQERQRMREFDWAYLLNQKNDDQDQKKNKKVKNDLDRKRLAEIRNALLTLETVQAELAQQKADKEAAVEQLRALESLKRASEHLNRDKQKQNDRISAMRDQIKQQQAEIAALTEKISEYQKRMQDEKQRSAIRDLLGTVNLDRKRKYEDTLRKSMQKQNQAKVSEALNQAVAERRRAELAQARADILAKERQRQIDYTEKLRLEQAQSRKIRESLETKSAKLAAELTDSVAQIRQLQDRLNAQKQQMAELKSKYKDQHPRVQQQQKQLQVLNDQLAQMQAEKKDRLDQLAQSQSANALRNAQLAQEAANLAVARRELAIKNNQIKQQQAERNAQVAKQMQALDLALANSTERAHAMDALHKAHKMSRCTDCHAAVSNLKTIDSNQCPTIKSMKKLPPQQQSSKRSDDEMKQLIRDLQDEIKKLRKEVGELKDRRSSESKSNKAREGFYRYELAPRKIDPSNPIDPSNSSEGAYKAQVVEDKAKPGVYRIEMVPVVDQQQNGVYRYHWKLVPKSEHEKKPDQDKNKYKKDPRNNKLKPGKNMAIDKAKVNLNTRQVLDLAISNDKDMARELIDLNIKLDPNLLEHQGKKMDKKKEKVAKDKKDKKNQP